MERSFVFRALLVGILFFIVAIVGAHLLFSWEEWQRSHPAVTYPGPYPVSNPAESSDLFIAVLLSLAAGLALLPVLAGVITALLLPAWTTDKKDVFKSAGFAGAIALALLSITFWALLVPDLIRTLSAGNQVNPVPYLIGLVIDILIVLSGAIVAGMSGLIVRVVSRAIISATKKRLIK